jgi:osmotically-inducible protein OsmY
MAQSMVKSDAQIQQDVYHELKWDTRVVETDVGVEVDHGIVTLTGTVRSYPIRRAAQEAAHLVHGVLDVANDIEVKLPGSSHKTDTDLAAAVRLALEWNVVVPEERIHTTVSHGWVTLEGEVESWAQRDDAERAVRRLTGVLGSTNKLTVPRAVITAETVRTAIEAALERQAEREADHLQVTVDDGVVTLRGSVRSWREKRAALGAAGHAPGIIRVEDQLQISPYS